MIAPKPRPRPVRCPGYVYCDAHCGIHEAKWDYADEGMPECCPDNWRGVYVMGQKGEFDV